MMPLTRNDNGHTIDNDLQWLLGVLTTIYNHLQPFTTIYNHLQPFTTIYNHLQPFTTIDNRINNNSQ
jgi:hypothetical protein